MNPKIICFVIFCVCFFTTCKVEQKSHIVRFEGEFSRYKWAIRDLNPDLPSDWSPYKYLTLEINASSTQRFSINLYDAEGIRQLQIHPFQNAWVRASIPLIHFQKRNVKGVDMAAIGKTALPGLWIGFTGSVGTISRIDSIGVEMRLPVGTPNLEIRNVRLTQAPEDSILSPIPAVDGFGQWIPSEWDGKTTTLEELKAAWTEEDKELEKTDGFNVSAFGGYLDCKVKATGFFRVEKIDGHWWFVDPEGYLFFSLGSTGIDPGRPFARIEGREYIFNSFPPDALAGSDKRIEKSSFDTWNLYRRFGDDWYDKWKNMTIRRMDAWGFNTIANWSDVNLSKVGKKAYVATLRNWGFNPNTMGMPDVYDSGYYDAFVDSAAKNQCLPLKDDPFLLGYFVGNEPPWPGREMELVSVILEGEDTPMKAALKKYLADGDTPERRKAFVYETYVKFITTVNSAIRKYDPNHLNLGLRFGGRPPEDIVKASASVGFDVFSINIYGYSAYKETLQAIDTFTGLPIIIGEFHFGTPGRGLAPGLAQTGDQTERGAAYRYYVENAAAHPSLIGTHWFQWRDQPATGRFDGENYNIGFIDVTDQPYKELINAAIETHKRIRDIHLGIENPVTRQAQRQ
ncbi:MAG: hypothetical protein LBC19_02015 [Tannerella sp.]|nr:hypothetical protein [Tannerella sp.]